MFFKLGVTCSGRAYHLLWVNPQPERKELFFQFITNATTRKTGVPTYKDGVVLSNNHFWDHLSIHGDGSAHICTKGKEYVQEVVLGHSIYDFGPTNIVPILSNTYGVALCPDLFKPAEAGELNGCLRLKKTGYFTILVLMVQRHNCKNFLDEYVRPTLDIHTKPILLDMGNDLHLLMVLPTAKVPVELRNGYLERQIEMTNAQQSDSRPAMSFGIFPTFQYLENGLVEQC